MAIDILPPDILLGCLKEHATDLGGKGINLFHTALNKPKSDLNELYLRPKLLDHGRSYIYIAEDKGGKGGRPNYDPGNTIAATVVRPESDLAFPGRWGLFTNPLGWVDINAGGPGGAVSGGSRGPRPSDRATNIGFCVYTHEFDQISLSDQLKMIWDGGLSRTDEILQCFRDYRGYEVVYGGRKSLHFHFIFDLRHWSHDLAFANNSSYQEHWLSDFPDIYLREAHENRWSVVRSALHRGTGIEAEPDPALRLWEQNRRVPLAVRLVEEGHPLGLPVGSHVCQYVLASSVRKTIPRRGKGWLHHSNLVGSSAVRHVQRHAKRKHAETDREGIGGAGDPITGRAFSPCGGEAAIADEQRRFDKFLIDNFPKLAIGTDLRYARAEFESQGPKIYLYNRLDDVNPSSIIQGDYKSVLLQGDHDFETNTYRLGMSPNRLLDVMIEQETGRAFSPCGGEAATGWTDPNNHQPVSSMSQSDKLERAFEAEVHDCNTYRGFLSEHIVAALSAARLVLILGPEGCGKTSVVMANIAHLVPETGEPIFISSPSYEQSAEKIDAFSAMHENGPYVAYRYFSLTELYQRNCPKGERVSEIDALEMGCPSWLRAIHDRQPQVYARMRAHRDELHAIRDRGQIPILFGVHETVRRHADIGMTRLFYARDFDERWFEAMTPDARRAYRTQLRFQTSLAHVVFDEVSPGDLITMHRAEHVHWAWEFERIVEQIPRHDKLARYKAFKTYRSGHPRPHNDDEWHDGKSDWAFIQEILTANYSDDDLVQITAERLPFDDTDDFPRSKKTRSASMYQDCIGRFYYVSQRWWWSGVSRTTLLTTELIPAQIIDALSRRCPVRDDDPGNAPYRVFRFDRPGLFTDFVHIENHRDCKKQTLPGLVEAYSEEFPGAVVISDMLKDRIEDIRVITHLSARGSNELDRQDIVSLYTAPSKELFAQLAALDARFGTHNTIALWYVDRFNQTCGRNRGFRGQHKRRHISVMSYRMYEWLAPYMFGWSRYFFPRRRCSVR